MDRKPKVSPAQLLVFAVNIHPFKQRQGEGIGGCSGANEGQNGADLLADALVDSATTIGDR